ncbi:hypothetical protein M446_5738 [Methylobacterium sp. 4-46]|uniref:hypothetical protein n=1 Tax=unclassified Methylobacterium TaxID=2615210 RepID=UPI000152D2C9|nr:MULTISPECIES: hypothetical protein [Methylobacterium]ACA20027.1 hypothetical protein M446_5738 [Methylobacterium sp. 4-46]WFT79214.1 hypothetical protein QA634_28965 [Methylobacterium nodulans]
MGFGFLLFLVIACGLPLLALFVLGPRVPDHAWAALGSGAQRAAQARPAAGGHAATVPSQATAAGAHEQRERLTSVQGADLEHGLVSNTARVGDGTDRRMDGTTPIGSGAERDGGSQAETMKPGAEDARAAPDRLA